MSSPTQDPPVRKFCLVFSIVVWAMLDFKICDICMNGVVHVLCHEALRQLLVLLDPLCTLYSTIGLRSRTAGFRSRCFRLVSREACAIVRLMNAMCRTFPTRIFILLVDVSLWHKLVSLPTCAFGSLAIVFFDAYPVVSQTAIVFLHFYVWITKARVVVDVFPDVYICELGTGRLWVTAAKKPGTSQSLGNILFLYAPCKGVVEMYGGWLFDLVYTGRVLEGAQCYSRMN